LAGVFAGGARNGETPAATNATSAGADRTPLCACNELPSKLIKANACAEHRHCRARKCSKRAEAGVPVRLRRQGVLRGLRGPAVTCPLAGGLEVRVLSRLTLPALPGVCAAMA